jgi:adenosylmethionine-8-amino-7-oxononanoate aminotransferase
VAPTGGIFLGFRGRLWLPSTARGKLDSWHVVLQRGAGVWAEAVDGERFLDANAGLWHLSLGYSPPPVVEAAAAALAALGGTSLLRRSHRWAQELVEILGQRFPWDAAFFFATSGSEAVDAALRIAFAYGIHEGRHSIAYLEGGYHGVSLAPLALNTSSRYRNGAPQAIEGVVLPSPTAWNGDPRSALEQIEAAFAEHGAGLAAVIAEPLQAVGGMREVPAEYLAHLTRLARRAGCLVVADEVSAGVFRSGPSFLASTESRLKPDLVVLAKGLTGGVTAMSVVGVRADISDRIRGDATTSRLPGSTQAGDPVGCAAAIAAIEELERPEAAAQRQRTSAELDRALTDLLGPSGVEAIAGRGHLRGAQIESYAIGDSSTFVERATRAGLNEHLLIHPLSNGVIPVVPALNVSSDEIREIALRLRRVVDRLVRDDRSHDA